jgi:adenylate cyclase
VASSDHALKDRTAIELNVKMGAAYHRQGRADQARRHFERARKMFDSLLGKGADDPSTRYYIACLHALTGDLDRAFDSLQRVAAKLPALTAARVRRDPDVEALKADPRFAAIAERQV